MQYYILINIILGLFFLSYGWLIYDWLKKDFKLKELYYLLVFSILVTLIFKFPYSNHFLGLEYEDAYVFNFSARQLSENIYPLSLSTDGISIGSINNPISTVTYGGHFITYPVFISWFYNIFGFNMYIPSYLNAFIELLTIFMLSVLFKKIFKFDRTWWFAGLIFSIAPVMNVFSNTHLAETFSSFAVLLSVLSFYYFFKSKKPLSLIVFGVFFLTALVTKRENLVIFSFYLVFTFYFLISKKEKLKTIIFPISLSIIIIAIYLCFIKNVFSIEQNEAIDISTSTFSFVNFLKLVPIFTKALFRMKWFGIHSILFVLAILYIIFYKRDNILLVSLIVLYISFFAIYTLHYRSYYFINFGKVAPFESLRYLNNFFLVSTIIIAIILSELIKNKRFEKISVSLLSIVLLFSVISTIKLRKNFSDIEQVQRFENPEKVLKFLSFKNDSSTLITDNILIFQLLGSKDLNLVDLNCLNNYELKSNDRYLFITKQNRQESYKFRHPEIIKIISSMKLKEIMTFNNKDGLYKIE